MTEIQPYVQPYPPLPGGSIPPNMAVAYTAQGRPVYIPEGQLFVQDRAQGLAPIVVQMPSQPIPAWLRNALLASVVLLILCTPAAVLLLVATPAIESIGQSVESIGQSLAWSGVGIGIAVVGVGSAIKAMRETPRQAAPAKKSK